MSDTTVKIYDVTLRDGTQGESISFSIHDKLRIAQKLDELGVHYIEGGWPGSNQRDEGFFEEAKRLRLKKAKIAAFGKAYRPNFDLLSEKLAVTFLLVRMDPLPQPLLNQKHQQKSHQELS